MRIRKVLPLYCGENRFNAFVAESYKLSTKSGKWMTLPREYLAGNAAILGYLNAQERSSLDFRSYKLGSDGSIGCVIMFSTHFAGMMKDSDRIGVAAVSGS